MPLTFLNSWYLIGLLSAAIPLLIHLSQSKRTKKMRFSTTRFFTEQFLRSYHMSRVKELLLLICRMALCAILALALARPLFMPPGGSFLGGFGGSRSVVLVVDDSASMGFLEDGRTMLDRARDVGRQLLDGLGRGDTASVVLAGNREGGPDVLFPQPMADLDDVRQALNAVQVTALGTDYRAAIERAEQIVQSSGASSKEIYVLGDLQTSGWQGVADPAGNRGASDALHFVVRVRPKTPANLAITGVQYAAARPMIGVPFAIRPRLAGIGDRTTACDVRLYVYSKDGKEQKIAERHVERQPNGRWAVPRFYHTFLTEGWHAGFVEVQDDSFPADNRRYFAFEVLDSIRLLAVNGAPSRVPRLDELFFLKAALTANIGNKSSVQMDVVSVPEIKDDGFDKYALVILANVESLTDRTVERLEQYVDRGGSLLVFLGDAVNPGFYNGKLADAARLNGGLLPGKLLGREKPDPAAKTPVVISAVDYNHEALAAFQDPKFANLSGVTFGEYWKADPPPDTVLIKASTGSPLLCERAFGKGRVMLFTSTCDRDWTNFPVRLAYLPFTYRLVSYLAQKPLGRDGFYTTGEWIPVPVSADESSPQIAVTRPDEKTAYPVQGDGGLTYRDTALPGVYRMTTTTQPTQPAAPSVTPQGPTQTSKLFAVNMDSHESNLAYLDDTLTDQADAGASRQAVIETGLKTLLPGRPLLTYVDDPARTTDASLTARRGFKLWDYFLIVVLILALFEPWLANQINVLHYSRAAGAGARTGAPAGRWGRVPPQTGVPPTDTPVAQEVGP